MVKGQTYSNQIFESEAFRHFVNTFLANESGITKGCELTQGTDSITIGAGYFVIKGGLLKEDVGSTQNIPVEAGYYKLVYEIDLSQVNTISEFNQGSYKFIKGIGAYPTLTQEDLENDGEIYQFEFCQFIVAESGVTDFTDKRTFLNFDSIYEEIRKKIDSIEDGSIYATKKDVQGTILYENENGTNATITLDDDRSNYKDVEIEYKCVIGETEVFGKIKIGKNQTRVNLQTNYIGSTNNWLINKNIKLLGNKITFETWSQVIFNNQRRNSCL